MNDSPSVSGKRDGGPAFPGGMARDGWKVADHGMSLRDYFAAKAMQQLLDQDSFSQGDTSVRIDAARCWRFADAMLAERDK